MLSKVRDTISLLLLSLLSCNSLAGIDLPQKIGWVYTGGGGRTIPGGTVLGLNLTDSAGLFHYTQAEMNTVANDYNTHVPALHFGISGLSVTPGWPDPVTGNITHIITPDPVTGYNGNVAVITGDFSPAVWDSLTLPYNEYGQACKIAMNLTLTGSSDIPINNNCAEPRDPPHIPNPTRSPYIAFAVIYINTHGDSRMLPVHSKHLHLLTHELGHVFGLKDYGCPIIINPTVEYMTTSVMVYNSDPGTCMRAAPTSLQAIDIVVLRTIY